MVSSRNHHSEHLGPQKGGSTCASWDDETPGEERVQQQHAVINSPVVRAHVCVHHKQLPPQVVPVPAPAHIPLQRLGEYGTGGAEDAQPVLAAAGRHNEVIRVSPLTPGLHGGGGDGITYGGGDRIT